MINVIVENIKECAIKIDSLLKQSSANYLQSANASGDMQLAVDVEADKIIAESLLSLPCVKGICSEEQEDIIYSKHNDAPYMIAYDPLDGSSLIDSNLSIGSIFGIYSENFSGANLIASGYVLYGVNLELVFAQEEVIHSRYNGSTWRYIGYLALQNKGKINAPGGTQKHWEPKHKAMVESLFAKGYRLRYSGGMVPDLHQILIKGGGLFSYPATSDAPQGKLRKLFEVFPMAFIYERANGGAIDGTKRLLELESKSLHESTPCFFGSNDEINLVKEIYS